MARLLKVLVPFFLSVDVPSADDGAGDFFFDEEEVLAGAGGADRAALLARYDAMLASGNGGDPSALGLPDAMDALMLADPSRFEDDEEDYDGEEEEESEGGGVQQRPS